MSDKDVILQFLERAEKRARSNKRFNEIATTLAIAFILPVTFKVLDLFIPFRARTVSLFFGFWLVATVAWLVWRIRGRNPLAQIAASIDRKASLNDQMKTAYWFIKNPRQSDWVDAQIQRTAKEASRIRIDSLYPRKFPRTSLIVAGLLFLLGILNFIPPSMNHNWVYLQAAPPFSLSEAERTNLEKALKLLEKAKAAENKALAEKIQELIEELQQGDISLDDAIKQLDALKDELEASDLDSANMTNGLQQMAAILRQAKALQQAAQTMGKGELNEAASQMRQLSERLQSLSQDDLQDMSQKLHSASENPRSGLQDLAHAFDTASTAIQRGDRVASQAGLDRIARELESIKQSLDDQALRSEAGDELADLVDSLEQRDDGGATTKEASGKPGSQGKADQKGAGKGEAGEKGEAQQGAGEPGQEGEAGEAGEPGEEGAQAGDQPGGPSEDGPNGRGGNSFGGSTKSAPLEGEATSLEVQLQKEALQFEAEGGGKEPDKDKEAAGERERSKLDYRNAPSDLTPAQKDLLNQDRIPWDSKQLIKNYFQAVKPKSK